MSTLAKLLVSLGLDAGDYHKGLQDSAAETSNFASSLATVGTVAVTAGAVAGAALVGVGVAGLKAFGNFQTGMSEVFTLLPGMSADAMGSMSKDVKDFAKEFGVLPEKEIPALYQALSAGVPKDNVFDFLATAQKAAVGGVTDLETAVDGITSVVNAYGPSVLSATKASDMMFTTVKLGKTNFEQLSASLFNVIPTAASAGVSFADVSAALASITLQGTPTSVATTQIRAALVEASKGGTKLDEALKALTGKSFPQLVAGGMDIGTIFNTLRSSMPDQQFKDLFGSVESLNAVLGITGPNAATFASNLNAMKTSAGATDLAYQTMNQTLGASANKLKAFASVFLIDIGEKLAPAVALFTNALIGLLNSQAVTNMINGMGDAIAFAVQWIITASTTGIPALSTAFNVLSSVFDTLTGYFGAVLADGDVLNDYLTNFPTFLQPIVMIIGDYVNVLGDYFDTIVNVGSALMNGDFQGALTAFVAGLQAITGDLTTYYTDIGVTLASVGQLLLDQVMLWGPQLIAWITPYIPIALAYLNEFITQVSTWVLTQIPILQAYMIQWGTVLSIWVLDQIPVVLGMLNTFIVSIIAWINTQPAIIANAIAVWATPFVNLVSTVTPQFLAAWPSMLNSFLQWLGAAIGPIAAQLGTWVVAFLSWLVPLLPGIVRGLGAIIGAIAAFIVSSAAVIISNVAQWGIAFLSWIEQNVLPKLPGDLAAVLGIFTGALQAILMVVQSAANLIAGVITGLMQILNGETTKGWATIQQSVLNFCAGIVLAFAQLGSTIISTISSAVGNMVQVWSNAGDLLISIVAKLAASVVSQLMGLASKAVSAGKAIVDGIISGVKSAGSALIATLVDLAMSALNAAKTALGIGSPSKVFADNVGTPIVLGIIQGLNKTWPLVTHWLKGNMAKTVAEFLKSSATLVRGTYDIFKSIKDLQAVPAFQPLIDATDSLTTAQQSAAKVSNELLDINAEIAAVSNANGMSSSAEEHVKNNQKLMDLYAKQAQLLQEQAITQGELVKLSTAKSIAEEQSVQQQAAIEAIANDARLQYQALMDQVNTMMKTDAKGALEMFNLKKSQIEELAQLQKERALATNADDRAMLDTQIRLLQAAQAAEGTAQTVTAQIQINPSGQSDDKIINIIQRALQDAGISVDIRTRTA